MTLIGFKIANENIEWPLLRELWTLADESAIHRNAPARHNTISAR